LDRQIILRRADATADIPSRQIKRIPQDLILKRRAVPSLYNRLDGFSSATFIRIFPLPSWILLEKITPIGRRK
jgi:hypothetical protein